MHINGTSFILNILISIFFLEFFFLKFHFSPENLNLLKPNLTFLKKNIFPKTFTHFSQYFRFVNIIFSYDFFQNTCFFFLRFRCRFERFDEAGSPTDEVRTPEVNISRFTKFLERGKCCNVC